MIMKFNYSGRMRRLQNAVARENVDALLITSLVNIRYLTGFDGTRAVMIIGRGKKLFLTDSRYIEAVTKEIKNVEIEEIGRKPYQIIGNLVRKMKIRRLGFEQDNVTFFDYSKIAEAVGVKKMRPMSGVIEQIRMIKDDQELKCIKQAATISAHGIRHIRDLFKSGITERSLAIELELFFQLNGAEQAAFPTIVAFGRHASAPHHRTSRSHMRSGNMVLIDFGARYRGYNSDLTRTVASNNISGKFKEIYNIVLEAQQRAVESIRPGRKFSEIDRVARDFIAKQGYGDHFGHGLGHGLGLEVHESPTIAPGVVGTCRKGMVFTIEPGIYLPGWGGVRIEDDIVVTSKGCRVLTGSCDKKLRAI
jgi:Xaa-Pro aminopeptidase